MPFVHLTGLHETFPCAAWGNSVIRSILLSCFILWDASCKNCFFVAQSTWWLLASTNQHRPASLIRGLLQVIFRREWNWFFRIFEGISRSLLPRCKKDILFWVTPNYSSCWGSPFWPVTLHGWLQGWSLEWDCLDPCPAFMSSQLLPWAREVLSLNCFPPCNMGLTTASLRGAVRVLTICSKPSTESGFEKSPYYNYWSFLSTSPSASP